MAQDNNQSKIPGFGRRPEGDDKSPRRGPKFSIYWVYGIVALFLVGYQLYKGATPTATVISDLQFRNEMLVKNDIQKLELVRNKDVVRVFIYKDSLNKPIYKSCWVTGGRSFQKQKGYIFSLKFLMPKPIPVLLWRSFIKNTVE